jgi:hypothetical protein
MRARIVVGVGTVGVGTVSAGVVVVVVVASSRLWARMGAPCCLPCIVHKSLRTATSIQRALSTIAGALRG